MFALGGLLISTALFALASLALIFRRPDPPAWTTRAWVDDLMAVAIVATFAVGLGCLGVGAITAYQEGADLVDLGLLAAVLGAALVIWRKLDLRTRLKAMAPEASAAGLIGPRAASPGPSRAAAAPAALVSAPEPPPSRPTRRVA